MLISDKKKFIFYHVYKVAGTSIRQVLRPYCSPKQVILQNLFYGMNTIGLKNSPAPIYKFHPRLVDVRDHMGDKFYSYYRFSFVRHPLDWQKSMYFFMKKNTRHHQHLLIKDMTFEEYINWRINNDLHLMSDLLCDSNGKLLVNEIYKFEDIYNEFNRLCSEINIDAKLPLKNIAGKGKLVDLSDSTYLKFRDSFDIDFINFDYE